MDYAGDEDAARLIEMQRIVVLSLEIIDQEQGKFGSEIIMVKAKLHTVSR